LREICARHWPWPVGVGLIFAGLSALIVLGTEGATSHSSGVAFGAPLAHAGLHVAAVADSYDTDSSCRRTDDGRRPPR
jgi:hypothetical protein